MTANSLRGRGANSKEQEQGHRKNSSSTAGKINKIRSQALMCASIAHYLLLKGQQTEVNTYHGREQGAQTTNRKSAGISLHRQKTWCKRGNFKVVKSSKGLLKRQIS